MGTLFFLAGVGLIVGTVIWIAVDVETRAEKQRKSWHSGSSFRRTRARSRFAARREVPPVLSAGRELALAGAEPPKPVATLKPSSQLDEFEPIECRCSCGSVFWCPPICFHSGTKCVVCSPFEEAARKFWKRYHEGALERGHAFEISFVRFRELIVMPCHYTGTLPSQEIKIGGKSFLFNGIDRMNSKLGYSDSNCVPCCGAANFAKRRMPYLEFVSWLDSAAKFRLDKQNEVVVDLGNG